MWKAFNKAPATRTLLGEVHKLVFDITCLASVTSDRTLSALWRTKNYLRSTMKQDGLNNCRLMHHVTNRLRTHWTLFRLQSCLLVSTNLVWCTISSTTFQNASPPLHCCLCYSEKVNRASALARTAPGLPVVTAVAYAEFLTDHLGYPDLKGLAFSVSSSEAVDNFRK